MSGSLRDHKWMLIWLSMQSWKVINLNFDLKNDIKQFYDIMFCHSDDENAIRNLPNFNSQNETEWRAFRMACSFGNLSEIFACWKSFDFFPYILCNADRGKMIEIMINKTTNLNVQDDKGNTLLIWAAMKSIFYMYKSINSVKVSDAFCLWIQQFSGKQHHWLKHWYAFDSPFRSFEHRSNIDKQRSQIESTKWQWVDGSPYGGYFW